MFLDTKPNKTLPTLPLPTDAQYPTETSCAGRLGSEMRPRDGAGTNVLPPSLVGRLHTSPPHASYSARMREQTETLHPGERDSGKRLRSGGRHIACAPPLSLNGGPHPPSIAITSLEEATNSTALDASPDLQTYCQHRATFVNPHLMHTLLQRPLLTDTLPLSNPLPLSPNTDKIGQLVAVCNCSPHSLPGAALYDTLHHHHTTR